MDLAGASGQVRGGMPNGRVFDRIQMLEQRVAMLADQAARLNEDGDEIATSARGSEDREMGTRGEDVPRELPPRLAVDDEDSATHFISPSHWEGILSDVRYMPLVLRIGILNVMIDCWYQAGTGLVP